MRLTVYVPQLATAVTLLRSINERMAHMATQDDVQALADSLGGSLEQLGTAYAGLSGDVQTLTDRITELESQVGPEVDLSPLTEVRDRLQSRVTDFAALDSITPAAPVEPTPEPVDPTE